MVIISHCNSHYLKTLNMFLLRFRSDMDKNKCLKGGALAFIQCSLLYIYILNKNFKILILELAQG